MSKVTVLCSVFNGERDISNMIESVLNSTFREFELLIIDDCSTDSTPSLLASWDDERIRVIRNAKNIGLTRSLNIGVRASRSDYISRIDTDDLFSENRLEKHVNALDNDQNLFMVAGRSMEMLESSGYRKLSVWYGENEIQEKLKYTNLFTHSAVTFRKDVFLKLGGYCEDFICSQDYELWHRAVYKHHEKVKMLDCIAVKRKIDKSSITSQRYIEQSRNGFRIRQGFIPLSTNIKLFGYQVLTSWLSFKAPVVVRMVQALKGHWPRVKNG